MSMCVNDCTCIYMCMYVYMYVRIHIHLCVYSHPCLNHEPHEWVCTCIIVCVYTHVYIRVCMYTYIYTYAFVCIYTYVHTHNYTHPGPTLYAWCWSTLNSYATWLIQMSTLNSRVTCLNVSCRSSEWVMSHIWMSRTSHMNMSWHSGQYLKSYSQQRDPMDGVWALEAISRVQTGGLYRHIHVIFIYVKIHIYIHINIFIYSTWSSLPRSNR